MDTDYKNGDGPSPHRVAVYINLEENEHLAGLMARDQPLRGSPPYDEGARNRFLDGFSDLGLNSVPQNTLTKDSEEALPKEIPSHLKESFGL